MASQAGASPRQLILLVGSDSPLLWSRERVIASGGSHVTLANTEQQAAEILRNHVFDLIVVSHTVPEPDFVRLEQVVAEQCPATLLLRLSLHMPASEQRYVTEAMPEALLLAVSAVIEASRHPEAVIQNALLDRERNRDQWLKQVDHLVAQGYVIHKVDGVFRLMLPDGSHSVSLPYHERLERLATDIPRRPVHQRRT
jgi:DNA-binding NtrC family response regulator